MTQDTDSKIVRVFKRFPDHAHLLTILGFGPDISVKILGVTGIPIDSKTNGRCSRWQERF
jgi:hypothetical protein